MQLLQNCIGPSIRISREIQCFLCAEFVLFVFEEEKNVFLVNDLLPPKKVGSWQTSLLCIVGELEKPLQKKWLSYINCPNSSPPRHRIIRCLQETFLGLADKTKNRRGRPR